MVLSFSLPALMFCAGFFLSRVEMTAKKPNRKQMLAHCDELRDDDGVDPREFFPRKSSGSRRQQHRKTGQLCQQVAETLSLVLGSEFDDPRLHNLQVVSVTPAPDATQLLVTVATDGPLDEATIAATYECLARVAGRLRSEVASAITRKRAPRLSFHIVTSANGQEVQP